MLNYLRPIKVGFFLIILFMKAAFAEAFDWPGQTVRDLQKPFIDQPANDSVFYRVVIIAILFQDASFVGCCYVFYRSFRKWKRHDYRPLSMAYRLPFYTALTDAALGIVYIINSGYSLNTGHPSNSKSCETIGFLGAFFGASNSSLFCFISLSTYFRVCRNTHANWGPYDYKLWTLTTILAFIFCLPGLSVDAYGAQEFWCTGRSGSPVFGATVMIQFIVGAVIALLCCIKVWKMLWLNQRSLKSRFMQPDHSIHRRVMRKLCSYTVVFIMQWFLVSIYAVTQIANRVSVGSFLCGAIGLAFGGIGNSLAYIYNESLITTRKRVQPSMREIVSNPFNKVEIRIMEVQLAIPTKAKCLGIDEFRKGSWAIPNKTETREESL